MGRHSTTRWVILVLLAGLVTTACGGPDPTDPVPAPTESATVDTTPTTESPSSPGPEPWPEPVRPEAMDRDDADGAQATAEYFMALYGYIFATGDLTEWTEMSHADCIFCAGAAERVTALHDSGGYAVGGEFTIDDVIVLEPDAEDDAFRVGLIGEEAPSHEYSSSGALLGSIPGGRAQYNFALSENNGRWQILEGSAEVTET